MPADLDAIMDTNDPFVRFDDIDNRSYQDIQGMGLTPPFHPRPYSSDTEVYTSEGWKFIPDVRGDELFLSPDPDNGLELEWVGAEGVVSHDPHGVMHHFHSQNFDLLVDAEHEQVFSTSPWSKTQKWKAEPAQALALRRKFYIPRCARWEGNDFGFVHIPGMQRVGAVQFMRFMAFWLSDGSVIQKGPDSYYVVIGNRKNTRVIYDAASEMLPWAQVYMREARVEFYDTAFGQYLMQFGHAENKFIPGIIKDASTELITEFLNAYLVCDGNIQIGKHGPFDAQDGSSAARVFYTTSVRLADDIGECVLKAGGYPRYILQEQEGTSGEIAGSHTFTRRHDLMRIYWNKSKTATFGRNGKGVVDVVSYDGLAYCVMLKKNHVLWVRRNGKTCFSGNCRCSIVLLDRRVIGGGVGTPGPRPPKGAFIPAKTLKEAEEWARKNVAKVVDYTGMDIKVANEVNNTLNNLLVLKKREKLEGVRVFSGKKRTEVAQYEMDTIHLSDKYFKSKESIESVQVSPAFQSADLQTRLAARTEKLAKSGLSKEQIAADTRMLRYKRSIKELDNTVPKLVIEGDRCSVNDVISHEFGHAADVRVTEGLYDKAIQAGVNPNDATAVAKYINNSEYGKLRKEAVKDMSKTSLSTYARTSGGDEYIAEAWAAYHNGGVDRLTPAMRTFIEFLDREMP